MNQTPIHIVALQQDDKDVLLLENMFKRQEFNFHCFQDERSLTQYIRIQPVARCLIVDLILKNQSVANFLSYVRRNIKWSDVPILVIAQSLDKSTLEQLKPCKINGYIVKPFPPARLFNDVLKLCGLEVITVSKKTSRPKPRNL